MKAPVEPVARVNGFKSFKRGLPAHRGARKSVGGKRRWNYPLLVDSSVVGYEFNEGMNRNRQLPALGLIYKSSELAGCISVPDLVRVSSLLSNFISLSFDQQCLKAPADSATICMLILSIKCFVYRLVDTKAVEAFG
ncbi:hypothetical protein KQX54_002506 [Cotesia glomerata]|uniref:Uncharacterized protein n=1 Tax=Cotesia glomerata TaxID=32391 RepID=A0AAV7HQY6_COTGL|nr:hypothetical protein KQX54_002506 [Cotesia glomerata]